MRLRMSLQDIVERSLSLERSGFKTGTAAGGDVATEGAALTGGTSFCETGSCVMGGTKIGPCFVAWRAYQIARQSSPIGS